MSDSSAQRPVPAHGMPMWVFGLVSLAVELALWGWFLVWPRWRSGAWSIPQALLLWLAAPLALRLVIALASYALSRVKGSPIPPSLRLGPVQWLRFFVVEYVHLCLQNLMLIPLRPLFRTPTERGATAGEGRVVLLQHGYVNNGAVWHFTARALAREGYRVFACDQPVFADIDAMGARLAARVDEVLALTGATQLTLVAHSMGGLVARAYLRAFGAARVDMLITLGSPHHGTWHAYFANGTNGRQMRPGNPWLEALNQCPLALPCVSIYSVHDTVISPQASSVLEGARNVRLSAVGHVSMPSGSRARRVLLDALARRLPAESDTSV
ncbi:MAG: alpha/beta fold hydrolase [Burkholderiales bacterium]|nr:alpha/beta fold hydrolase [Burkholderiales bacterium]